MIKVDLHGNPNDRCKNFQFHVDRTVCGFFNDISYFPTVFLETTDIDGSAVITGQWYGVDDFGESSLRLAETERLHVSIPISLSFPKVLSIEYFWIDLWS